MNTFLGLKLVYSTLLYVIELFGFFQIDSAMALTSLNNVYMDNEVNKFFPMNGKVTVNATLELFANSYSKYVNLEMLMS